MNSNYIESGRTKQKQKTRNAILASAKRFLTSGQDFTLEDIAESASISRATVYRYFSNVDILALEAGLDIHTKSPEMIYDPLRKLSTDKALKDIQSYYNHLAIDNEAAFRRYLSLVISPSSKGVKRGARRNQTLRLAMEEGDLNLTQHQKEKLIVVLTTLMGIEAMIVTKDVCQLNNKESIDILKWGLEMVLNGLKTRS
ncbi:MAG: TetR/AcrR family transcriptional regulator [Bacteroidia bacterium]|nr:TetR/AcrR family transcriptional regulator [Bacteroidia bacterium]